MTIPHEMAVLAEMLKHHGIYYELVKCYDGVQLFVPAGDREFSAIFHSGSYGSQYGLLEVWDYQENDPTGWMTGKEAFQYILQRIN